MSSFEKQSQDKSLALLETLDNSLAAETWALLVDTGAATSVAPKSFAPHLELSPAPSTLQLATATGEAIKIFGLRHVHLQCQDLSFKVSFVIADVVTPILGLDTLMPHHLSLSFEHDQRFLVNKAGQRIQLEHMGRHLYLVASPFQHGLSTCFSGSLSDVIGFLPEDKELHEQEIALESSSSTDLVEDQKQEQDEQDSLNFQCHSVLHSSFREHVKGSFVCALCDEEVAVPGGELSDTSFHPFQQSKQSSSAKMSSFITSIPDLFCIDLRSLTKQKAKSLYMHCGQLVCMNCLILLGMIQLCCSEVNVQASFQDRRILAKE